MGYYDREIPSVLREDIERLIADSVVDLTFLEDKTIFVTGATGVIGYNLVHTLLYIHDKRSVSFKIIALVRDIDKASSLLGCHERLNFVKGDVRNSINISDHIDYIIHAASITSSRKCVESPADVIETSFIGTDNVLRLAKENGAKKVIFLSSMEVYGTPQDDEIITEEHGTDINTMDVRSCYPESKRLCESLCRAYMQQYDIPVIVLRLTQTFGMGVSYDDPRVFAEFARCAIEDKNIILHTDGSTKRSYLYTADAVSAILVALLRGVPGEAYNVANEDTYCSIYEMASLVCRCCANGDIDVVVQKKDTGSFGYAPKLTMNLDSTKIRELGWKPEYDLEEMFRRLCKWMRQNAR